MHRTLLLFMLTLGWTAACGRPPAPAGVSPVAGAPAGACERLAADAAPDTIVVGIADPVDPAHAPVPGNAAERFVFGTLYEPLVRLDCSGHLLPGLAARWTEDGPRRWRFTLRPDARFWDGTPVTSADVAAAWAGRAIAFAESLETPDPTTLTVVLTSSDTAAMRRFADPGLAVARAGPGAPPAGTTPYRVSAWTADWIDVRPVDRPAPVLRFRLAPGADPRDLLDERADLVVTGDPEALKYAAGRDALDVVPLPWAWTYVLAGPWAIPPTDATALPGLLDAVRGDARLAEPPFWWTAAPPCPTPDSAVADAAAPARPALAYLKSDAAARDLADRLAALSAEGQIVLGTGPLRTQALGPADAPPAAAGAATFITAVPRRAYGGCRPAWLGAAVPLVDVRRSLIGRRGRAHVVVDWDGAPRLLLP